MQKFLRFGILCLTLCFTMNCTKTETTPQPTQQAAKGTRKDKSSNALLEQLLANQHFVNSYNEMRSAFVLTHDAVARMTPAEKTAWRNAITNLPQTATIEDVLAIYAVSSTDFVQHIQNSLDELEAVKQDISVLQNMSTEDFSNLVHEGNQQMATDNNHTENWFWCIVGAWNDFTKRVNSKNLFQALMFLMFEVTNCLS